MNTEHTSRILAAARRVVSANQEAQPREYHEAMSELEKIVSQSDSPLDTQPANPETPRMETLLAALKELVRELESSTSDGYDPNRGWVRVSNCQHSICHETTFNNAKAAIQAATTK